MLIGIFYSQIVERSSLVSVLFREAISHPYISFFHLLVNGFSVMYIRMGDKKSLNGTLAVDSPFQTLMVDFSSIIDYTYVLEVCAYGEI